MNETWMPIPDWETEYAVSNQGRVKSLERIVFGKAGRKLTVPEKFLKGSPNEHGYLKVSLSRENKRFTRGIHQLVLSAFVGPAPDGMVACHFDDIKNNNQLENLRWDTRSSNSIDRVRNGNHYLANKTSCAHGHLFSEENTYQPPGRKKRVCKTCTKQNKAKYREKGKTSE